MKLDWLAIIVNNKTWHTRRAIIISYAYYLNIFLVIKINIKNDQLHCRVNSFVNY